jgi:ABC-type antimicrobial peptide transport system permease subunit
MTVLVCFGVLAAGLAVLGVYGLFSWIVALRRRELAIRLTLGARPAGVGLLIVRQAAVLALVGLAAGWAIVRLADGLLARVLFETSPADPWSTAGAVAALLAASLIACAGPAWRAMATDPVDGLRTD